MDEATLYWTQVSAIATAFNAIAMTALTGGLIYVTQKISTRQNKLQENGLQVNLYQYRMNCYLQIFNVLDIIGFDPVVTTSLLEGNKNMQADCIRKLSECRMMSMKAHRESKFLFDENVFDFFGEIVALVHQLYDAANSIIYTRQEVNEELKNRFKAYILKSGLNEKSSDIEIMQQFNPFRKSEENKDFMDLHFPAIKTSEGVIKQLGGIYESDRFSILLSDYLDIKNIGIKSL